MAFNKNLFSDSIKRFSRNQRTAFFLLFFLVVALSFALPLFGLNGRLYRSEKNNEYLPGMLADEDVIAAEDFSFVDTTATEEAKEEARKAVKPRFVYSLASSVSTEKLTDEYIKAMKEGNVPSEWLSLFSLYQNLDESEQGKALILIRDAVRYYQTKGVYEKEGIQNALNSGYTTISAEVPLDYSSYSTVVKDLNISSLIVDDSLYGGFLYWIQVYSIDFSPSILDYVYKSLEVLISANTLYDERLTAQLRDSASDAVSPILITVQKGEYILKQDTIITTEQLRILERISSTQSDISISEGLGRILFFIILLATVVIAYFLMIERRYRIAIYTLMLLSFMIVAIFASSVLIYYIGVSSPYITQALPFLFVPLLMTHLTSRKRFGFIAGCFFASVVIFLPGVNYMTFFYYLFMIETSLLFVRFGVNRIDMIYQAFYTGLSCMFFTLFFHIVGGSPFATLPNAVIIAALNVVLTYILLSILLPLFEHFFNIPTVFRLHELCSTDMPILARLRAQAPGTYNHVNNVSDMAYLAAKEIGANAELAKAGALYHDIGKAEHPEYFIENQGGGHNIHDDMKVTLSAAVIKSHVKLGVEKGKEIGLPQEVIDIIDEHHGNDVISYFYNEAVKEAQESKVPYQVNEEDFKYNSDIPQTREAAICMLADCFEAASRTLKKPTNQRFEKLITSIIVSKINHEQLNDSHLTMTDLEKIKRVFIYEALGRDHQRIEYENTDKESR